MPGALARAIAIGVAAAALAGCGYESERGVGVSRRDGLVRVHFVLCRGDVVMRFRLQDYGISYGSGLVGPVLWELESEHGRRLTLIRAGAVPAGFDETVPFRGFASSKRVIVTDFTGTDTMSFLPGELRTSTIFRGDYERVTPERFRREGRMNCRDRVEDDVLGLGLTTPVLLALLLLARRAAHRARRFAARALSLWLSMLAAFGLAGAAVVWLGVLFRPDVNGAELPLAIAGVLTFGFLLLLVPLPLAAVAAALTGPRRPRDAAPAPLRPATVVRFAALAVSVSLVLALVVELVRPWTLAAGRLLS